MIVGAHEWKMPQPLYCLPPWLGFPL
jgi:hypothetical protein